MLLRGVPCQPSAAAPPSLHPAHGVGSTQVPMDNAPLDPFGVAPRRDFARQQSPWQEDSRGGVDDRIGNPIAHCRTPEILVRFSYRYECNLGLWQLRRSVESPAQLRL